MLAIVNGDGRLPAASLKALPDGPTSPWPRTTTSVADAEPRRRGPGEAGWWLRGAAAVLAVLAAASAAVSWQAQYVLVLGVKHVQVIAAIEAGIPDAGALVFAALGVAVALHGRRAVRPRLLNAACIAVSLAMNALAAGHGWRDLAIWVMPAAIYAVASDTLIGVVHAQAVVRRRADGSRLGDESPDLLAALGGVGLWVLRLVVAGPSTLSGFRSWVIEECPVAPGRRAPGSRSLASAEAKPARVAGHRPRRRDGLPSKRDRLVSLAGERRDLARMPLGEVSGLATALAQEIGYSAGTARRELIRHVREVQSGSAPDVPAVREGAGR
ncbi:MAG TPA: hypothetical protein VFQ44_06735 [Streptosporangiaceae bacterium]|nr:hypothetical protein [Streptosporangiaceae bacterium]